VTVRVFVSGSGTDVGKTFITAHLVRQLRAAGRSVAALKPVISGFDPADVGASDTGRLLDALGHAPTPAATDAISPWRFAAPLSPDMAADRERRAVPFDALLAHCRGAAADVVLCEGVGGVMVPLDDHRTVLDWMTALGWPVLLVVGGYLGTLSHTLTAWETVRARGLEVAGIIVSASPDDPVPLAETAHTLSRFTDAPIATVPRLTPGAAPPDLTGLLPR
jgi:dethiobiotin synthetase